MAARCSGTEDPQRVIQKFIQAQRSGKAKRWESGDPFGDSTPSAHVRRGFVNTHCSHLPPGLVGPPSTAQVKVEGKACTALLDSGSQVTIIFDSWYSKHLAHVPLCPVNVLAIWGLSDYDNSYPYRGYVQVELEFTGEGAVSKGPVAVLALVCPDPRCSDNIPVLLSTNVHRVRPFTSKPQSKLNTDPLHPLTVCTVMSHSIPSTQTVGDPLNSKDKVAHIKWVGPGPLTVPPACERITVCRVHETQPLGKSSLITEYAQTLAFPSGVLVQPTVLFSSALDKGNFLVRVRNESCKEVSIPAGTIIAHLSIVNPPSQ